MEIKYNKKFEYIVGNNFSIEAISYCKAYPLIEIQDILFIDGVFYFKKFAPKTKTLPPINKMIYEFDTNCLRVDNLIKEKISNTEQFWCGLSIAKELVSRLYNLFGNGFEIILSYDYTHCYVRFYKIREGINNVMSNDLEGFKMEAILRIVI